MLPKRVYAVLLAAYFLGGCTDSEGRDKTGSVVGNVVGTAGGAVIGSSLGKGSGSVVGGVVGGVVGSELGVGIGSTFDGGRDNAPDPTTGDSGFKGLDRSFRNDVTQPPNRY